MKKGIIFPACNYFIPVLRLHHKRQLRETVGQRKGDGIVRKGGFSVLGGLKANFCMKLLRMSPPHCTDRLGHSLRPRKQIILL